MIISSSAICLEWKIQQIADQESLSAGTAETQSEGTSCDDGCGKYTDAREICCPPEESSCSLPNRMLKMLPMLTSADRSRLSAENLLKKAAKAPVYIYRWLLFPIFGMQCRFHPSCSAYALEAIQKHGPVKGWGLSLWRVVRCGPWSRGGFDPVPCSKERK